MFFLQARKQDYEFTALLLLVLLKVAKSHESEQVQGMQHPYQRHQRTGGSRRLLLLRKEINPSGQKQQLQLCFSTLNTRNAAPSAYQGEMMGGTMYLEHGFKSVPSTLCEHARICLISVIVCLGR
jgi:hypothetical protein